jgi:hypothetical protein
LHRLAARDRAAGTREDGDALDVAGRRELVERASEQVVASSSSRPLSVLTPRRRAPTAELGAVDQVVVDERRDVDELDRHARRECALAIGRGEVHEERAEPLPAGGDRAPTDGLDEARMARDGKLEPLLELVQVGPGLLEYCLCAHRPPRGL